MKKPVLIVITGPTASGKSALAVTLAQKLNTEIISADSRQVFKEIPIVTAVPSLIEREGIPHHLLEILPLEAYYSAAKFQEDTETLLHKIFKTNDTAIVCGGSMLYIDALVKGIDELPTVPTELRANLMSEWSFNGDGWLLSRLKEMDPDYYYKIDHRNLKRVFHAVEISLTAKKPYSQLLTKTDAYSSLNRKLPFDVIKFCLTGERETLFERINARVLKMMASGLEAEATKVYPLRHLNSLNTVGLKEMFAWFEGTLKQEEVIPRIQKNTRVYAKKQLTWHKRDNDLIYLDFSESNEKNVSKIMNLLYQKS